MGTQPYIRVMKTLKFTTSKKRAIPERFLDAQMEGRIPSIPRAKVQSDSPLCVPKIVLDSQGEGFLASAQLQKEAANPALRGHWGAEDEESRLACCSARRSAAGIGAPQPSRLPGVRLPYAGVPGLEENTHRAELRLPWSCANHNSKQKLYSISYLPVNRVKYYPLPPVSLLY